MKRLGAGEESAIGSGPSDRGVPVVPAPAPRRSLIGRTLLLSEAEDRRFGDWLARTFPSLETFVRWLNRRVMSWKVER